MYSHLKLYIKELTIIYISRGSLDVTSSMRTAKYSFPSHPQIGWDAFLLCVGTFIPGHMTILQMLLYLSTYGRHIQKLSLKARTCIIHRSVSRLEHNALKKNVQKINLNLYAYLTQLRRSKQLYIIQSRYAFRKQDDFCLCQHSDCKPWPDYCMIIFSLLKAFASALHCGR